MFNLLKGFTKPFAGQSSQTSGGPSKRPGDRLEDGFLLVGQTASERNTVIAGNFQYQSTDAPPGYKDVMDTDGLPDYSAYSSVMNQYSPTVDISQHPGIKYGNPKSHVGTSPSSSGAACNKETTNRQSTPSSSFSPVSDIPFILGPCVRSCLIASDLKNSNILYQQTFDASIYEYDFNVELNFLHGHNENCMEVN